MKLKVINKSTLIYSDNAGLEFSWEAQEEIADAAYYPESGLFIVISVGSENAQYLQGIDASGHVRFKVKPPKNYTFYYLSTHVDHEIAVVCFPEMDRFLWFFSINSDNGELTSLNRAY